MANHFKMMLKRFVIASLLLGSAWALSPGDEVGIILSTQGTPTRHQGGRPASTRQPLRLLDDVKEGDTLYVEAEEKVTFRLVSTGDSYEVTGPMVLKIQSSKPPVPGPGLAVRDHPAERKGIAASKNVDLSKFGGASSRALGDGAFPVYLDQPTPRMDLDAIKEKFESTSFKVRYRMENSNEPWQTTDASLVHLGSGRDQLVLPAVKAVEDRYLMIYWGDKANPADADAQFKVLRLPEKDLASLRQLEQSVQDWPARLALYECYTHWRLFDKAEKLLDQWQKDYPKQADWVKVRDDLDDARTHRPVDPRRPKLEPNQ